MASKSKAKNWRTARSLADMGELTVLWLLGQLPHPGGYESPDEETMRIQDALVRLNRGGFVTEFSQPGEKLKNGFAQRAAVSGFCSEAVARKLAALTLCSDLIVIAYPPNELVRQLWGYMIPITVEDYHPFTWSGRYGDPRESMRGLSRQALKILRDSWYVVMIDPRWGREKYLWQKALRALQCGTEPFQSSPSPDLPLDTDFVY